MDMQTETGDTPVRSTRQGQIPGTEKGSKELKKLHEAYARAKYRAKAANDRAKELKPDVIELMEREGIDALRAEVDYGEQARVCVTKLVSKSKLLSKLDALEDDD